MKQIIFSASAWEDYTYWIKADRKILDKINRLIKEIQRTPFSGSGKPEPLKYELASLWSRRIDREHRIVYQLRDDDIVIVSCRYHYD